MKLFTRSLMILSSAKKCSDSGKQLSDKLNVKFSDKMFLFKGNNLKIRSRILPSVAVIFLLSIGFPLASSTKANIRVTAKIPSEAEIGESVNMDCSWVMEGGKTLYSVKWYKDGHEFFRYMPKNYQKIQTFDQNGVKLDTKSSREGSIRLLDLSLASSGQYKCEVSADAPAFATSFKTGNLTVISLPIRGPEISGLSSNYVVGENVTANCTSSPSVPKANLHWTINGKPVNKESTINYSTESQTPSAESSSVLGLHLETEARHFTGASGSVKIRCLADVSSRRYEAEKHVQMAHVNNQRLSASDFRGNNKNIANNLQFNFLCFLTFFYTYIAT